MQLMGRKESIPESHQEVVSFVKFVEVGVVLARCRCAEGRGHAGLSV